MIEKDDVIQFNENHKWCGCLGIIREVKTCQVRETIEPSDTIKVDIRYMVGVPIPQQGTAFIYVMESENALEKIGKAVLTMKDGEESE